jgi:uncharacterized protein DUF1592/uncharacterized protein DUF1588/uncharacterized protein DUF1585/uncharacterized protein DUF1587/uncharacterized protein DUF1595
MGAALGAGCIGNIGGGGDEVGGPGTGPEGTDPECIDAVPDTEPVIVRMLNRREYENTVRDLLGVPTDVVQSFPPDAIVGFDNQAQSLVASSLLVEQQLDAAEVFAAAADVNAISPCAAPETCIDELIESFGRRAFRRPLDGDETAAIRAIWDDAQSAGRSVDASVRLVIEGFLVSPQFLYRAETTAGADGALVPADPYEVASRLSYFLWASMPDDTLLDAAAAGELGTPEALELEARRMLADPRAHDVTAAFHEQWLELYKLQAMQKDDPAYDAARPLFAEETARFAEHVFWEGDATQYLVSDTIFANDELAAYYGMSGPSGSAFEATAATDDRFGLLTQGSMLSIFSNSDRTSPTRRGKFVRSQLLCQPPPPPPADVPPLEPGGGSQEGTLRERLAAHVADPVCKSCHQLIDPIGFGLEHYDTTGRYRTEDGGGPVDSSGELIQIEPGAGPFDGARELSDKLAESNELYACIATQWFRFAVGRQEGPRDACTLDAIEHQFRDSGDDLTELLVAIATSDAFLLKNTEPQQ